MSSSSELKKKCIAQKWSSDHVIRFLELFERYELLWNSKNPDYANKNKRDVDDVNKRVGRVWIPC